MERLRPHWPVLLVWLLVCAGMFVYCWMDPVLDDMVGWIPAILVLQVPSLVIAAQPVSEEPGALPSGWSVACAASLGLVLGCCVFLFVAVAGFWIWNSEMFEMRPIILGFGLGLLVWIFSAIRWATRLRRGRHPEQLRRALIELALAAAIMTITILLSSYSSFFGEGELSLDELFLLVLPFLWTAPLWLVLPRRERPGPPRAKVR